MMTHITRWFAKVSRRGFPGTSREGGHLEQIPFHLIALTFLAALGMLAISLFWPFLLQSAITIKETDTPHSGLAFMFLGAGTFFFPLLPIGRSVQDRASDQ